MVFSSSVYQTPSTSGYETMHAEEDIGNRIEVSTCFIARLILFDIFDFLPSNLLKAEEMQEC